MQTLLKANQLIKSFEGAIDNPKLLGGKELFTGIDLGTAYVVLAVVDEEGNPVAGAMEFAQVVRDGLVVDYVGAVEIIRKLKKQIEQSLGTELLKAGISYPPGTVGKEQKVLGYIAEAVGFEVISMVDEPTAANYVLGIENGAVIDIGGGTTGVAIFKEKNVVYVADEATGGTHFSLVISGAYKVPFDDAEEMKKDRARHRELFTVIKPVIEKVSTIVGRHIKGHRVETAYLAGGTSCFDGMEKVIAEEIGVPVIKPKNPFLVTPLGIALSAKDAEINNLKRVIGQ